MQSAISVVCKKIIRNTFDGLPQVSCLQQPLFVSNAVFTQYTIFSRKRTLAFFRDFWYNIIENDKNRQVHAEPIQRKGGSPQYGKKSKE